MKSKDDGRRGPGGPDRGVTTRYITKKSPRNVGMVPYKTARQYLVFSARLSFWTIRDSTHREKTFMFHNRPQQNLARLGRGSQQPWSFTRLVFEEITKTTGRNRPPRDQPLSTRRCLAAVRCGRNQPSVECTGRLTGSAMTLKTDPRNCARRNGFVILLLTFGIDPRSLDLSDSDTRRIRIDGAIA